MYVLSRTMYFFFKNELIIITNTSGIPRLYLNMRLSPCFTCIEIFNDKTCGYINKMCQTRKSIVICGLLQHLAICNFQKFSSTFYLFPQIL